MGTGKSNGSASWLDVGGPPGSGSGLNPKWVGIGLTAIALLAGAAGWLVSQGEARGEAKVKAAEVKKRADENSRQIEHIKAAVHENGRKIDRVLQALGIESKP